MRTFRKEWHVQDKEPRGDFAQKEKASMHPGYILKGTKIEREQESDKTQVSFVEVCSVETTYTTLSCPVSREGHRRIYKGECCQNDCSVDE